MVDQYTLDNRKKVDAEFEKYANSEKEARLMAYKIADADVHIADEVANILGEQINAQYMKENCVPIKADNGQTLNSIKARPFKDNDMEKQVLDEYVKGNCAKVIDNAVSTDKFHTKVEISDDDKSLYMVKSGQHKGLCFMVGKDGLALDIANTPFENLSKKWQASNTEAGRFVLKMLSLCKNFDDEAYVSIIHANWCVNNDWELGNGKTGMPSCELSKDEWNKDLSLLTEGKKVMEKTQTETK